MAEIKDCNVLQGRHLGVTGSSPALAVPGELATQLAVSNREHDASYGSGEYSGGGTFGWSNEGLDDAMGSLSARVAQNSYYLDKEYDDRVLAVSAEETARLAGDATLQSNIDAEAVARGVAIAALQADVDQNESDSDAAHSDATTDRASIRTEFALADTAEANARVAADTTLQNNIDAETARIDAILLASDADKDSFAEIVQLINSVDLENDDALAAAITSLNASVAAVQADVDQNEADADSELALLDTALGQEETARVAADSAATTDRAAIRSEFAAADSALQSELDASQAGAGLASGGGYVANAAMSYIGAAVSLKDADEKLDVAMAALQADVDQNEADADAAVLGEKTRAMAAEAAIQADVDQNEADSDAAHSAATTDRAAIRSEFAAADSSEASTRASADAALSGRLDTLEGTGVGSLAKVEADALAGRNAIQADVDQNEADSDAAHAAATTDRAAIRSEFAAADATEKSEREAADVVLQNNIDTEKGRVDAILLSADADKDSFAEIVALINSVDTENDSAFAAYVLSNDAAVAAVQADVDQNEADSDAAHAAATTDRAAVRSEFAAADAVISGNLSSEVSRATAAESALSGRIDAYDARIASSAVIASTTGRLELSAGVGEPRMVMTKTASGDVDVCFDLG